MHSLQTRAAHSRTLATSTAIGALMLFGAGQAAAAADTAMLEELVVTAQKRTERLQDVPVAVTAITGEGLEQRGIDDASQLALAVPSLTFAQGNAANNNNIRIRGVGTAVFSVGVESSVSTVLDGVVLARQTQGFVDLADIERIEVLRGPQGTLFGKNSTAGVVNVVSKRPTKDLSGSLSATIAEQGEYRLKGTISGPLSDTLRLRLTGFYNDVGGHIYNITTKRHVNGYESYGLRGKAEWDVTDDLNLLLNVDWRTTTADCCASIFVKVDNPQLAGLIAPIVATPANRKVIDNRDSLSKSDQQILSLEGNWQLGFGTLTSITAYQDYHTLSQQPTDRLNTPRPIFITPGSGQLDVNDGTIDIYQWSQELRLTSPAGQRLTYVLGLYYLDLDIDRDFQRRIGTCTPGGANGPSVLGAACAAPTFSSVFSVSNVKTTNYAAFGQGEFRITDQLSAIAGARVQYEKVSFYGIRPNQVLVPGDSLNMAASAGDGVTSDTSTTGKVGLQYRFNARNQTYATWSTGYKGAGWGTELASDFLNQGPVLPEKAEAWELGYKGLLFEGRLSVAAAAFSSEVRNIQIQTAVFNPVNGVTSQVLGNAGGAESKGVEVEISARPTRRLTLTGGVTYLKTSLDVDGLNCGLTQQLNAPTIPGAGGPANQCFRRTATGPLLQNVRGGDLPNAPTWKGNLTARYDTDLPNMDWKGFAQVSVSAQSKFSFGLTQDPLDGHDGYATVDVNVGLRSPDNRRTFTLYVKNLGNEHYLASQGPAPALTSATLTPTNLTAIMPKEASRYVGAIFAMTF